MTQLLEARADLASPVLQGVSPPNWPEPESKRFIALVTGATDGIGEAVAHRLAGIVDTLVVHGRCPHLLGALAAGLAPAHPGTSIVPVMADLGSFSDVRYLADTIHQRFDHLDVLVNNAATAGQYPHALTSDGNELTFQANYLSPVLLTAGLFDLLQASESGRIVNVVCDIYKHAKTISQCVSDPRRYHPVAAYAQSKFTQMVHTAALDRALAGGQCSAVCLDPGHADTKLGRKLLAGLGSPVSEAADNVLYAVTMPTNPSAFYLKGKKLFRPEPEVLDVRVQNELETVTEELLGIRSPWLKKAHLPVASACR